MKSMYWYAVLDSNDEILDQGTINANSVEDASREFKRRFRKIWTAGQRLCVFSSYEAYVFYIKKGNYQWIDPKDIIKL